MEHNRESDFTESIFDTNASGNFKLWKSCPRDQPIYEAVISETPLHTGYVGKRASSKRTGTSCIQDRYFVLTKNYLYFKKRPDAERVSGYLDNNWARIAVYQDQYVAPGQQDPGTKFTIKIIRNLKFTSLFFDDYREFYKWKQALINVNFI